MIYFLDASAWVKRYVKEPGSDAVRALLRRQRGLAASAVSLVEIPSAIWKRFRRGDLGPDQARRLAGRVADDLAEVQLVEVRAPTLELAAELVAHHPLRAYDAIQLASALRLMRETAIAITFACADAALAEAAGAEGLRQLRVG